MTNALFKDDFITEKVYRSSSDFSASDIKTEIKYNGFTLWDQKFNPNTRPKPPTTALKLGSMLHKAVLEPNEFNSYYQVIENKRTKEGKAKMLSMRRNDLPFPLTKRKLKRLGTPANIINRWLAQ